MKHIIIVLLLSLSSFTVTGQSEKFGAIRMKPLPLALGVVNVSYEQAIAEKKSALLEVGFIFRDDGFQNYSGFGLRGEIRFYTRAAIDNFYFAPLANIGVLNITDPPTEVSFNFAGLGVKIGWSWLLGKSDSFILDLGLGAQYLNTRVEATDGSDGDIDFLQEGRGIQPILNFGIGYAFNRD